MDLNNMDFHKEMRQKKKMVLTIPAWIYHCSIGTQ